jgi:hypothetical protein
MEESILVVESIPVVVMTMTQMARSVSDIY